MFRFFREAYGAEGCRAARIGHMSDLEPSRPDISKPTP